MPELDLSGSTGYSGLSTDVKPSGTHVLPGEVFVETDTNLRWVYTGFDWARQGSGDIRSMTEGMLILLNRLVLELARHSFQ